MLGLVASIWRPKQFFPLQMALDNNRSVDATHAVRTRHLNECSHSGTLYFVSPDFVATLLLICSVHILLLAFRLLTSSSKWRKRFDFVSIGLQFFVSLLLKFDQNFVSSFRCLFRKALSNCEFI
jgi:hypothetical protein